MRLQLITADRGKTAAGDGWPDGCVMAFDEDGKLILARLAPEGYSEIGRTDLLEPTTGAWTPASGRPKIWAQPAYANGHIFARSDKEVVCASLEATP